MFKLISSGNYQPKEYSFDDYIRYVSLARSRQISNFNHNGLFINEVRLGEAGESVTSHYIKRLKSLNHKYGWLVSMEYIDTIIAAIENNNIDVDQYFSRFQRVIDQFPKTTNQAFNAEFVSILESLFQTFKDIYSIDMGEWHDRGSAVFAPRTKSLEYWNAAWARVVPDTHSHSLDWVGRVQASFTGAITVVDEIREEGRRYNVNESIVNAHITNLKMILNPNFHTLCMQEFSPRTIPSSASPQITQHVRLHPGFLLGVYRNPLFQHWLVRAMLLALIITSALVAAAFMVKLAVLPVAVAGFVTGLSQLAANRMFGAAVTVGVAATATLVASIHASFFSAEPRDNGGASSAAHSVGYQR